MDLLQHIQVKRARRKEKHPYRRTPCAVVGAIVARFGLDEVFVRKFNLSPEIPMGNTFIHGPLKRKKSFEGPLFSLSDRKEYLTVRQILKFASNPYVAFACSPDELLWAQPLFAANPRIPTELLAIRHFETLFLAEIAKARIVQYSKKVRELSARGGGSRRKRGERHSGPESSQIEGLRGQIKLLKDYISFIENPSGNEGD